MIVGGREEVILNTVIFRGFYDNRADTHAQVADHGQNCLKACRQDAVEF